MSKATDNRITPPPSRRSVLTGAVAAGVAAVVPVAAVAAVASPDPVLVIAAERDRLRAIYLALDARVTAICEANPAQMWGHGWPRVDRSLGVFNGMPWRDGYNLSREEIERSTMPFNPGKKAALLKWWDDTSAEMKRLAEVTGYRQASKDLDGAVAVFCDKEGEMADVQATTIAGALVRLETALKTVADSEDPDTFERMALGAFADLRRLTGTAVAS